MKKFLATLVLGLLWCNVGLAEKVNLHKLKFSKDITKGYNILRQYGERTKAEFVSINCLENHETSLAYKPQTRDEPRLDGKNNKNK